MRAVEWRRKRHCGDRPCESRFTGIADNRAVAAWKDAGRRDVGFSSLGQDLAPFLILAETRPQRESEGWVNGRIVQG